MLPNLDFALPEMICYRVPLKRSDVSTRTVGTCVGRCDDTTVDTIVPRENARSAPANVKP